MNSAPSMLPWLLYFLSIPTLFAVGCLIASFTKKD